MPSTHHLAGAGNKGVQSYRELLRTLKSADDAVLDGPSTSAAFQLAKQRVLLRLQERRQRVSLDPVRAFTNFKVSANSSSLIAASLQLQACRSCNTARCFASAEYTPVARHTFHAYRRTVCWM